MIAALFILSALSSSSATTRGAAVLPPGRVSLGASGGFTAVFPTVTLQGIAGVGRGADVALGYETHAGLVHSAGLALRVRLAPGWALRVGADYAHTVVSDLGGLSVVNAPFANGLTTTWSLQASRVRAGSAHLAFALGYTSRWVAPRETGAGVESAFAPAFFYHAHAEASAEWPAAGGSFYLAVRAIVPILADLQVLGYFPQVLVGRTWGAR